MNVDFRIAARSLRRKPLHTLINLTGLTVGLACFILIFRFAQEELSYDRFHEHRDRIFQIGTDVSRGDGFSHYARAARATAEFVQDRFPEIEAQTMVAQYRPSVKHEGRFSNNHLMLFAEPGFAELFSFPVLDGDLAAALATPRGLAISRRMKDVFFGEIDALGQSLIFNDSLLVTVMAVLENPPSTSHIQFDALLSYETKRYWPQLSPGDWMYMDQFLYVKAAPGVGKAELDTLLRPLPMQQFSAALAGSGIVIELQAQPLSSLYLDSQRLADIGPKGSRQHLNLYLSVGFVILLLAGINYVNLNTARATERAKEVGIRKVSGSMPSALISQFLAEAVMLSMISFLLALLLASNLIGPFNLLANKSITVASLYQPSLLAIVFVITLGLGLLSGLYPALIMSRFKPVDTLRGRFSGSGKGLWLRRGLVFAQFVISLSLVSYSLVISAQIGFVKDRPLGFDRDHHYLITASSVLKRDLLSRLDALRNELGSIAGVMSVTASSSVPGKGAAFFNIYPEGLSGDANTRDTYVVSVDESFADVFGLRMMEGNFFSHEQPTSLGGWVINRKLLSNIGWGSPQNAIGKTINLGGQPKTVIGVMDDFHYHSLKSELGPLMLQVNPPSTNYITVRLNPTFSMADVGRIEAVWARVFPEYPFVGSFLDDDFDTQYQNEQRILSLFLVFTLVAVLIAGIGLYGMISYAASLRLKEMGIRKVLGAGTIDISRRLTTETGVIILLSIMVAFPVAWSLSKSWLESFAYRIDVGPEILIKTLLLAVMVTLAASGSVVWQTVRRNPSDVLRVE